MFLYFLSSVDMSIVACTTIDAPDLLHPGVQLSPLIATLLNQIEKATVQICLNFGIWEETEALEYLAMVLVLIPGLILDLNPLLPGIESNHQSHDPYLQGQVG